MINLLIAPFVVLASRHNELRYTNETHDLKEDSFDAESSNAPHFLLFFEPECPSCKTLLKTWESLATKFHEKSKGKVVIGKVDCVAQASLCTRSDLFTRSSKYHYGRLPGVASDEGIAVGIKNNVDFEKCSQMCDENIRCNSFAFCNSHECNLKDRVVSPSASYNYNSICFTGYRTNDTMTRIYLPNGKKMTWDEIKKEANQKSYKLPLIDDFESSGIMEGDDISWMPVRRRDGLRDDWVSTNSQLCPEKSIARFCSHRDTAGIPEWSTDASKQTKHTLSYVYVIPIMTPKLIFFNDGLNSSFTHQGRRDLDTLSDFILVQRGKVKRKYEDTNDLIIDAGCKDKVWDDSNGYTYDKYTWKASGTLLAKGVCIDNDYRPYFVPEKHQTKIYSTIEYHKLRSVDARNEMMSIDFVLTMRWVDPNIRTNFSTSDKVDGGIILSPQIITKIWTPDLDIFNQTKFSHPEEWRSLKRIKVLISDDIEKLEERQEDEIQIHKATMELRYEIKSTVHCNFNHKKYPMDTQMCRLRFGSRSLGAIFVLYDPNQIYHIPTVYTGDRFEISSKFFDDGMHRGNNTIGIKLTMQRIRQSFYVKYYIPCGAIVLVSQLGFFIPVTAIPGRVSLLITLFLSLINLLIYQMGESPSSSDLNAIAIYLLTSLSFIVGALIEFAMLIFLNQNYRLVNREVQKNKITQSTLDFDERMNGKTLKVKSCDNRTDAHFFKDVNKAPKDEEIGNCSGQCHPLISNFCKIDYISFGVFVFLFITFNCIYWTYFLS